MLDDDDDNDGSDDMGEMEEREEKALLAPQVLRIIGVNNALDDRPPHDDNGRTINPRIIV
jgi:hypothetical protein